MKTAEKMIQDFTITHPNVRAKDVVAMLMRDYGRQCAEQALKDAAETKQIDGVTPYFSPSEQLEITNTTIVTP